MFRVQLETILIEENNSNMFFSRVRAYSQKYTMMLKDMNILRFNMYISLYLFINYLTFGKMFLGDHGILLKNNCYFWWTIYIFKFKNYYFFMWMGICLCVYLCIMSMPAEVLADC